MIVKHNNISIFPPKASRSVVEGSNGINLESICTEWKTEEEGGSTGNYVLDASFLVDKEGLWKNIVEEAILKVRIENSYEYFVINKPKKNTRTITVTALHITIREQKQLWLDDVRPTDVNGLGALQHLYNNGVGEKVINLHSDIPIVSTAYYQEMSLYKALYDCDQSFINRWGGETERKGFNVYINQKRGSNSNLVIREGKNLTGFDVTTNTDTFCTRGIGKGFDGIKGHYVESPLIDKYARVNTQVFEYKELRLRNADEQEQEGYIYFDTEAELIKELDKRVALEFSENHVDEIQATYDISFEQLADTEEYKEYSYLETASIGDIVKVYVPSLDIEVSVRVVKKVYNGLTKRVDNITLSNTATSTTLSMASIIADLKQQYIKTGKDTMNDYLTSIINAGMQDSNVIIRQNELLIMDTKDINTAKSVWRWNNGALLHTNNGYYATDWNIGLTKDGIINADMIKTGILTAITIKSEDDSFIMNLGDDGGCTFYSNNKTAMKLQGTQLRFYNWGKDGDYIGSIGSLNITDSNYPNGNPNKPFIGIWNDVDSALALDYAKNNTKTNSYMTFDKNKIIYDEDSPIQTWEKIKFNKDVKINACELYFGNNNSFADGQTQIVLTGSMLVTNDLRVNGDKNCIQQCEYGDVKFSSVEDIGSYLTWREYGGIYETELDENGEYSCIVTIPQIIKSTINTRGNYNIEVNAVNSLAAIGVFDMTEKDFIIKSTEPCKFNFVLTGRRKGFEQRSLEEQILEGEKFMKEQQEIAIAEYEEYGMCIDD